MGSAKNVLIFLESSLELVPREIAGHPVIVRDARRRRKKPEEILLDDSRHHAAMKGLKNREKRGRADIIHTSLLLFLDSRLKNEFEVYVHTVNDELIWINPKVRLPRSYPRFAGLMEDLFRRRVIEHGGVKLLEILDIDLEDVLEGRRVIVLREGKYESNFDARSNLAVCLGAFPHGDYSPEIIEKLEKFGCEYLSFGEESYTTLYVTCRIISMFESWLPKS